MRLSKEQKKIIKIAKDNVGITKEDVMDLYRATSNLYRSLKKLEDKGLLTSFEAPVDSKFRKIYHITERGKSYIRQNLEDS